MISFNDYVDFDEAIANYNSNSNNPFVLTRKMLLSCLGKEDSLVFKQKRFLKKDVNIQLKLEETFNARSVLFRKREQYNLLQELTLSILSQLLFSECDLFICEKKDSLADFKSYFFSS